MLASLDTLVSEAVFAAHRLERAVHDAGPWTVKVGSRVAAAERIVLPTGVLFIARFPSLDVGDDQAVLECAGEPLAYRSIEVHLDEACAIHWEISIPEKIRA